MCDVDATTVIDEFERFSIVEMSRETVGEHTGDYFEVHDLYLDIAIHIAKIENNFEETVSKSVIYSYIEDGNVDSEEAVHLRGSRPSSSEAHHLLAGQANAVDESFCASLVTVAKDGFIHSNVFGLLWIADMAAEGVALIRDPRWIARQLNFCGWKQVEIDILITLLLLDRYEDSR